MEKWIVGVSIILILLLVPFFLYLEIQYPDIFNKTSNCLSILASVATIFAACLAVFTLQDFRKQKRTELLSQLSKDKLNTINFIAKELTLIFLLIKTHCNNLNENNLEHFNPVYLSEKLQDVKENEKLSDICINFNWELDNIYTLVNKNDQKLIQTTEKLLRKYIGLLWSLNDNIKEYEYVTSDGQTKFLHYIKQNQLLFKQIDQNLKHLKSLLKNNFLYI